MVCLLLEKPSTLVKVTTTAVSVVVVSTEAITEIQSRNILLCRIEKVTLALAIEMLLVLQRRILLIVALARTSGNHQNPNQLHQYQCLDQNQHHCHYHHNCCCRDVSVLVEKRLTHWDLPFPGCTRLRRYNLTSNPGNIRVHRYRPLYQSLFLEC